jgi:hypothetical protein
VNLEVKDSAEVFKALGAAEKEVEGRLKSMDAAVDEVAKALGENDERV